MIPKLLAGLSLLAVPGTGAAADTLPFEGKWARQGASCGAPAGAGDGAPIVVTASSLSASPFMTCTFKSVLPGGISYRVEASCDASGEKGEEFFTFAVLSGRLYW
jgi:hypothetical protein